LTDNSLQSADKDQQEIRAVAEKPHDAVVKLDTYRNVQRHRAVLPSIARVLYLLIVLFADRGLFWQMNYLDSILKHVYLFCMLSTTCWRWLLLVQSELTAMGKWQVGEVEIEFALTGIVAVVELFRGRLHVHLTRIIIGMIHAQETCTKKLAPNRTQL